MKSRRWFRKLYLLYKIFHSKSLGYLFKLIPENNNPYASQSALNNHIPFFNVKTNFLKNSIFPAVMTEWSNLDIIIRNSSSCHVFKKLILKFIRRERNRNSHYCCARQIFFEKVILIDSNILQQDDFYITKDLLFGNEELKDYNSNPLFTSTIEFIQSAKRFKSHCFNHKQPVKLAFTL